MELPPLTKVINDIIILFENIVIPVNIIIMIAPPEEFISL